jgi:ATP diphosphatase
VTEPARPASPASKDPRTAQFAELCAIMERLRDPQTGCPWDLKQDLQSLIPYVREEMEEAADAAARVQSGAADPQDLREELGDLLFNVVFTAELCREKGWFSMADVVAGAAEKIRRRHPHIFGDLTAKTPEEVEEIWRRVKDEERAEKERKRQRRA